jgi:hypothetical protein
MKKISVRERKNNQSESWEKTRRRKNWETRLHSMGVFIILHKKHKNADASYTLKQGRGRFFSKNSHLPFKRQSTRAPIVCVFYRHRLRYTGERGIDFEYIRFSRFVYKNRSFSIENLKSTKNHSYHAPKILWNLSFLYFFSFTLVRGLLGAREKNDHFSTFNVY